MDVERELRGSRVPAQLLEPVRGAGADGVRGDPDVDASRPERFETAQVVAHRVLPKALDSAARVGDVEEHELDPGLRGRFDDCVRDFEAEVVELSDSGVAGGPHLPKRGGVLLAHSFRRLGARELEHRVAPGPEVAAFGSAAQCPLEGMAVCVYEPRQGQTLGHENIVPLEHVLRAY